jgi:hypothetical protein
MALLQAARALQFGLTLEEAKSWGLNRALFYAAAKRAWADAKAIGARRPVMPAYERSRRQHDPVYVLGNERAFRMRSLENGLRFKLGERVQTPEEFDRRVLASIPDAESAWADALAIIRSADRRDLDIQSRFFNRIYKPRRDALAERWSRQAPMARAA